MVRVDKVETLDAMAVAQGWTPSALRHGSWGERSLHLYRVTVDTRQHCTDNAEGERPPNTSILATLRRCTVGKLSANC